MSKKLVFDRVFSGGQPKGLLGRMRQVLDKHSACLENIEGEDGIAVRTNARGGLVISGGADGAGGGRAPWNIAGVGYYGEEGREGLWISFYPGNAWGARCMQSFFGKPASVETLNIWENDLLYTVFAPVVENAEYAVFLRAPPAAQATGQIRIEYEQITSEWTQLQSAEASVLIGIVRVGEKDTQTNQFAITSFTSLQHGDIPPVWSGVIRAANGVEMFNLRTGTYPAAEYLWVDTAGVSAPLSFSDNLPGNDVRHRYWVYRIGSKINQGPTRIIRCCGTAGDIHLPIILQTSDANKYKVFQLTDNTNETGGYNFDYVRAIDES